MLYFFQNFRLQSTICLLFFSLIFQSFWIGCQQHSAPAESGKEIRFVEIEEPDFLPIPFEESIPESAPKRIVSLLPSCTEILFALELGDRVIGVDRWADYPPAVENLPRLGDYTKVNTETIIDLKPDLVILHQSHSEAGELLRRAGIPIFIYRHFHSDNVYEGIAAVAEAADVEQRGAKLVNAIQDRIAAVEERYEETSRKKVLVVFERYPSLSIATRNSFFHNLIQSAGGINISANVESTKAFTYVSLEQIIDWKPDVIIDLAFGNKKEEGIQEAKQFWGEVIGENTSVYLLNAPVITRTGPRMWFCVELLAKLIHDE